MPRTITNNTVPQNNLKKEMKAVMDNYGSLENYWNDLILANTIKTRTKFVCIYKKWKSRSIHIRLSINRSTLITIIPFPGMRIMYTQEVQKTTRYRRTHHITPF